MTAALSDRYDVGVVDRIRALTAGITDTPRLPGERWEQLVRRCAEADGEVRKVVARVDRRTSLLGLARRFQGEAARADQHPGLRDVIDRLVAGNGKAPSNDDIDKAVDAAAQWSYRTRQRAQVVQVACDQLPSRIGIADARWASQAGPPKKSDGYALIPPEPFARFVRHAALSGDLDALVIVAQADAVTLDHGKHNGEIVPVTTNNPAVNSCRIWTWLLPVVDRGSTRERAGLLLRAPQWREALDGCRAVGDVVNRIANGSVLLSA